MKFFMSLVSAARVIECETKRSQPGTLQYALELVAWFPDLDEVAKLDAISEKRQARDDIVPFGRRHNNQTLVTIWHTEGGEINRHRRHFGRRRHARSRVIHHVRHVVVA
jgi:hypothetical protein